MARSRQRRPAELGRVLVACCENGGEVDEPVEEDERGFTLGVFRLRQRRDVREPAAVSLSDLRNRSMSEVSFCLRRVQELLVFSLAENTARHRAGSRRRAHCEADHECRNDAQNSRSSHRRNANPAVSVKPLGRQQLGQAPERSAASSWSKPPIDLPSITIWGNVTMPVTSCELAARVRVACEIDLLVCDATLVQQRLGAAAVGTDNRWCRG